VLLRQSNIDYAAVDGADLDDVIPDGNLAADLSLDMRLYVSGGKGLSHGCLYFSSTLLTLRLTTGWNCLVSWSPLCKNSKSQFSPDLRGKLALNVSYSHLLHLTIGYDESNDEGEVSVNLVILL
jgi:hypothetical protein